MPYINIRVAGPLTVEQKQKMSENVTKAVSEAANKPPESILLMIDEVPRTNVAKAGKLLDEK